MRATRTLLALVVAAAVAACSGDNTAPLDPNSAPALRDGTGYFGTGNMAIDTTATSSTDDGSTSTERGTGYFGTGN